MDEISQIAARHRAARPKPQVNPAWANAEHDIEILLAKINDMQSALTEARRYVAYLADEDRTFVGKGMPADCLKIIDAVLTNSERTGG